MKDGGLNPLPPLTEGELGAYLDEDLDAATRATLDRRLDANPDQREAVERIRLAEAELLVSLDTLLDDPLPDRLLALLAEDDETAQDGSAALAGCTTLKPERHGPAE